MKTKKFVSVLCACAMLLSALPFASAAEPLSEFAGQTISIQVSEATETGVDSRVIQVAIPEGATKAEEDAIVYAAALGQEAMIAPLSSDYPPYILSTQKNFTIHRDPVRIGGGNKLPAGSTGYDEVIIDITFSPSMAGSHTVYFKVADVRFSDNSTAWKPENVTAGVNRYITIGTIGLVTDPTGGINVYAKTDDGHSVPVLTCTVLAVASAN